MGKLIFNKNEADNKVSYNQALKAFDEVTNINKELVIKNKKKKTIIFILSAIVFAESIILAVCVL